MCFLRAQSIAPTNAQAYRDKQPQLTTEKTTDDRKKPTENHIIDAIENKQVTPSAIKT